jgi:hypothetical protein
MKKYSPGASVKDDYAYICDCCEIEDGRPTLVWHQLPKRKGHFCLCYECLAKLNRQYAAQTIVFGKDGESNG